MAALKNRVERLEKEQRFQQWFHFERFLEGLTEEQLDDIVIYCRFPEPLPEPLPPGASRFRSSRRSAGLYCHREQPDEINLSCSDFVDDYAAYFSKLETKCWPLLPSRTAR